MENAIHFEMTPAEMESFARFVKTLQENGVQFITTRESRSNQLIVIPWSPEGNV